MCGVGGLDSTRGTIMQSFSWGWARGGGARVKHGGRGAGRATHFNEILLWGARRADFRARYSGQQMAVACFTVINLFKKKFTNQLIC